MKRKSGCPKFKGRIHEQAGEMLARWRYTLLTRHDLAKVYQIDKRTVTRYHRKGILPKPAFAIGSFVRWRWNTIKKHISQTTKKS